MDKDLKPATGTDCPEGGTIGKDWKTFNECSECALWDDCSDEHEIYLEKQVGESSEESSEEPTETPPETSPTEKKKSRRSRRRRKK